MEVKSGSLQSASPHPPDSGGIHADMAVGAGACTNTSYFFVGGSYIGLPQAMPRFCLLMPPHSSPEMTMCHFNLCAQGNWACRMSTKANKEGEASQEGSFRGELWHGFLFWKCSPYLGEENALGIQHWCNYLQTLKEHYSSGWTAPYVLHYLGTVGCADKPIKVVPHCA